MTKSQLLNVPKIPNLPPPSSYVELSCEEQWNAAAENIGKTVFGLAWWDDYLVGCTSSGSVIVWQIPTTVLDDEEYNDKHPPDEGTSKRQKMAFRSDIDDDILQSSNRCSRTPVAKLQASTGVLYSIAFLNHSSSLILGVCGDEGIKLYSWSDIENLIDNPSAEVSSLSHFRPHTSQSVAEINDFAMDENLFLYGASGDSFGCYKWDTETETLLKTYSSPARGYLHTLKVLPASTTPGGHSVLLMGGEGGVLGVWDRKQDQVIETLDIKAAMNASTPLMSSTSPSKGFSRWNNSIHLWSSHIHASTDSSSWWHVCGGAESHTSKSGGFGGYMTSWHAPTRSLAAGCATRESLNHMASYSQLSSSPSSSSSSQLATIGNESVVSYWSPTRAERTGRFWCTPPCAYAIDVRETDGRTAVGGVGHTVDILEYEGPKVYSVSLT